MITTFVDANVLITAFRADEPASDAALRLIGSKNRSFVASQYLRLETLRKPIFYRRKEEIEFMETYFDAVTGWARTNDALVQNALIQAVQLDLGAMDALHATAALQMGVQEFITLERPGKALFRVPGFTTLSPLSVNSDR